VGLAVPRVEGGVLRLLLRLPNWVGDVVMAAPAVEAIHRARPDACLVAQARPGLLALAALLPGVSAVLPAGGDRGPRTLLASRRRLRDAGFDAAVVFPRGTRALLAPWLARIPVRVGFSAAGHRALLTHPVAGWRPWRRRHRSAFFGLLARAFTDRPLEPWHLEAPPEALARSEELLRGLGRRLDRRLVALEPGASYGPAKCWPAERFGALARRLLGRGFDVVTVGTAASRDVEARVAARAGARLLRAAGRTPDLAALAGVLASADLLVANDTGPMHVGAALGTPVLALFGATDPGVSGPIGPGARRILREPTPCAPCLLRACPVAGHPCLEALGVGRVAREALDLLAGRAVVPATEVSGRRVAGGGGAG